MSPKRLKQKSEEFVKHDPINHAIMRRTGWAECPGPVHPKVGRWWLDGEGIVAFTVSSRLIE